MKIRNFFVLLAVFPILATTRLAPSVQAQTETQAQETFPDNVVDQNEKEKIKRLALDFGNLPIKPKDPGFLPGDKIAGEMAKTAIAERLSIASRALSQMYFAALRLKTVVNEPSNSSRRNGSKGSKSLDIAYQEYNADFGDAFALLINALTFVDPTEIKDPKDEKNKVYIDPIIKAFQLCQTSICLQKVYNAFWELMQLGFELNSRDITVESLSNTSIQLKITDPNIGLSFSEALDLLIPPNDTSNAISDMAKATLSPFVVAFTQAAEFGNRLGQLFTNLENEKRKLIAYHFGTKEWKQVRIKDLDQWLKWFYPRVKENERKGYNLQEETPLFKNAPRGKTRGKSFGSGSSSDPVYDSMSKTLLKSFANGFSRDINKRNHFISWTLGRLNRIQIDQLFTKLNNSGKDSAKYLAGFTIEGALVYLSDFSDNADSDALENEGAHRGTLAKFIPFTLSRLEDGSQKVEVALVRMFENSEQAGGILDSSTQIHHLGVMEFTWDRNYTFQNFSEKTLKFINFQLNFGDEVDGYDTASHYNRNWLAFSPGLELGWKTIQSETISGETIPFHKDNKRQYDYFTKTPDGHRDGFYSQYRLGATGTFKSTQGGVLKIDTSINFGFQTLGFLDINQVIENQSKNEQYNAALAANPQLIAEYDLAFLNFQQQKIQWANQTYPGVPLSEITDAAFSTATQTPIPTDPGVPKEPTYADATRGLDRAWSYWKTRVDYERFFSTEHSTSIGAFAEYTYWWKHSWIGRNPQNAYSSGTPNVQQAGSFRQPLKIGVYLRF